MKNSHPTAFTLLETLIATAIAVSVLGGGVTLERTLSRNKQVIEERAAAESLVEEGLEAVRTYQSINTKTLGELLNLGMNTNKVYFFVYDEKDPLIDRGTVNLKACPPPTPPIPIPPWLPQPTPLPPNIPCRLQPSANAPYYVGYGHMPVNDDYGKPQMGEYVGGDVSFISHKTAFQFDGGFVPTFKRFYSIQRLPQGTLSPNLQSYIVTVQVKSLLSGVEVQRSAILTDSK